LKSAKPKKNQPKTPFRAIPIQQIPLSFRPLAIKITELEKAILTTKNALNMNFDHIIDLLIDLKKTSMNLITEAKMMEKVDQKEDNSTS